MVKLDPRKWHASSLANLDRVNHTRECGAGSRIGANFRAALTGTASIAAQFFVLLLKNTLVGVAGGALRCICIKTSAPGWSEWRGSAAKTAAYVKGTFLSTCALVAFFSPQASLNNIRYQNLNVEGLPSITRGIESMTKSFNDFSDFNKSLLDNHSELVKGLNQFLDQPQHTFEDIEKWENVLTPRIDLCNKITALGGEAADQFNRWHFYVPPARAEHDQVLANAIASRVEGVKNQKNTLNDLHTRLLKKRTHQIAQEEFAATNEMRALENQKAFASHDWNALSITQLKAIRERQERHFEQLVKIKKDVNHFEPLIDDGSKQHYHKWLQGQESAYQQVSQACKVALRQKQEHAEKLQCDALFKLMEQHQEALRQAHEELKQIAIALHNKPFLEDKYDRTLANEEALYPLQKGGTVLLEKIKASLEGLKSCKDSMEREITLYDFRVKLEPFQTPIVDPAFIEAFRPLAAYVEKGYSLLQLPSDAIFKEHLRKLSSILRTSKWV